VATGWRHRGAGYAPGRRKVEPALSPPCRHEAIDIRESPIPTVPNAAIIVRAGHVLAGVLEGTKVHLVPITVGASDGNRTQVTSGLSPGQTVANDFPAELPDGATIQPFVVQ
jgi:hypothetical protein